MFSPANRSLFPLSQHDQLRKMREAGRVFKGFVEGEIMFDPTYKYDLHTDVCAAHAISIHLNVLRFQMEAPVPNFDY